MTNVDLEFWFALILTAATSLKDDVFRILLLGVLLILVGIYFVVAMRVMIDASLSAFTSAIFGFPPCVLGTRSAMLDDSRHILYILFPSWYIHELRDSLRCIFRVSVDVRISQCGDRRGGT